MTWRTERRSENQPRYIYEMPQDQIPPSIAARSRLLTIKSLLMRLWLTLLWEVQYLLPFHPISMRHGRMLSFLKIKNNINIAQWFSLWACCKWKPCCMSHRALGTHTHLHTWMCCDQTCPVAKAFRAIRGNLWNCICFELRSKESKALHVLVPFSG